MRLYTAAILFGLCSTLAMAPSVAAPASAQSVDRVGPHNPYCGSWQSGVWTPNGNCVEETVTTTTTTTSRPADSAAAPERPSMAAPERPSMAAPERPSAAAPEHPGRVMQRLRGTIIGVNGHMVTLQQSTRTLVINDSPALSRLDSGRVAVGRQVTAHGYWEDDTFFVTRFD